MDVQSGKGGSCDPHSKVFHNSVKAIYSKGPKLPVAVHPSFADISICQLGVPFYVFMAIDSLM